MKRTIRPIMIRFFLIICICHGAVLGALSHTSASFTTAATAINIQGQPTSPPVAPTELSATPLSETEVDLAWEHENDENVQHFYVERSEDEEQSFEEIAKIPSVHKAITDKKLNAGTSYLYRVRAANNAGSSDYSNVAEVTTMEEEEDVPDAPSALVATALTSSSIELTWAHGGTGTESFVLERALSETGSFTEVAEITTGVFTYIDEGLDPNTAYFYRVKARNSEGDSDYSLVAEAQTLNVPPDAPFNLVATATSSSEITLTWEHSNVNYSNFIVERSDSEVGPFSEITSLGTDNFSFVDNDLEPNTTYYYQVKATNASGDSDYSGVSFATTEDIAPAAPSGADATPLSSTVIRLTWTDNADNEDNFIVERAPSAAGTFVPIETISADVTTFDDEGLTPNTAYYYRIMATNSAGNSDYAAASATTNDVAPEAPINLGAEASSPTTISLTWDDVADNEDNYIVERSSSSGGSFTAIVTLSANIETYEDEGLSSNTTYYYRVKAVNEIGDSGYSNEANATTEKDLPAAPSGLAITDATTTSLSLQWNDNSNNESGFVLERSHSSTGGFSIIHEPSANSETYQDTELAPNTTYYYRISASNADGSSGFSATSGKTDREPDPPLAPSDLVAVAVSRVQIKLTWEDNASNENKYEVRRASSPAGPFVRLVDLPANRTSYENTGLTASTTYYYQIAAINADGETLSNIANATTFEEPQPPAAPSGLQAEAVSTVQVNLTWQDNSDNETLFLIERATTENGPFTPIADVSADMTSYTNYGLSANTVYYYRVQAQNNDGASSYSNTVQVQTKSAPQPPAAPTALQATGVSTAQINLAWQDNANNETGFEILRSTSEDGTFVRAGIVGTNVEVFQNTGLNANTTYYYKVRAINELASDFTATVSASTFQTPQPPSAPSNLIASTVSTGQINLQWEDNSDSETGFEVQRSTSSDGPFSFVVLTSANITEYENTGLTANTTYFYRVRATNSDGNSSFSNQANATTLEVGTPPGAPDGFTAVGVSTTQINLTWNDRSDSELGFYIERSTNESGPFNTIATVDANDTTYENTGLNASTTYYYRVRAFNESGSSGYSNVVNAATLENPTPPSSPSSLYGIVNSLTAIELFWTDNSNNENEFILERAVGESGSFTPIATLNANVTSYLNDGLSANTRYKYRIRAQNSDGFSEYSNEAVLVTTVDGKPQLNVVEFNYPDYFLQSASEFLISLEIAAEPGMSSMVLYYRGLADNNWETIEAEGAGPTYEVEIPANYVDEMGLEFYFEGTDADGINYVSTIGYTYMRYDEAGLDLENLKFGASVQDYQMISVPLVLERNNIVHVFEDDLGIYNPEEWRLFHYESGTLLEKGNFNTIEPGKGYWLIAKENANVNTGEGTVVEVTKDDPYTIALNPGWNQIGNPYPFAISWQNVLNENENPDNLDPLTTFSGEYNESSVLEAFQGAYLFLHGEDDLDLEIPLDRSTANSGGRMSGTSAKITRKEGQTNREWFVDFTLTSGEIRYSLAGFGMHPQAAESRDRFDRIALPRFAEFIDLNFNHPEYHASKFTRDIVPLQEAFTWDIEVVASSDNTPVNISWDAFSLPSDKNLILYDPVRQKTIDMTEVSQYVAGSQTILQVFYGDDAYIQRNLQPGAVTISSAYPNPFSSSVFFNLSLPEIEGQYEIQVQLYNTIGSEIAAPYRLSLMGGFHEVKVDEHILESLEKGLYFYKIKVTSKSGVLKEKSGRLFKR